MNLHSVTEADGHHGVTPTTQGSSSSADLVGEDQMHSPVLNYRFWERQTQVQISTGPLSS